MEKELIPSLVQETENVHLKHFIIPEIEEAIKLYYKHNNNLGANLNRLIVAQDKTV